MSEVVMFDDWIERCKRLGFHAVKLDTPKVLDWYEPTIGKQVHMELWYYIADENGKNCNGTPWQTEDLAWEHIYLDEWQATLLEVRNELSAIYLGSGDKQAGRDKADKLLLQAFRALESNSGDDELMELVEQIAQAYERVKR